MSTSHLEILTACSLALSLLTAALGQCLQAGRYAREKGGAAYRGAVQVITDPHYFDTE